MDKHAEPNHAKHSREFPANLGKFVACDLGGGYCIIAFHPKTPAKLVEVQGEYGARLCYTVYHNGLYHMRSYDSWERAMLVAMSLRCSVSPDAGWYAGRVLGIE